LHLLKKNHQNRRTTVKKNYGFKYLPQKLTVMTKFIAAITLLICVSTGAQVPFATYKKDTVLGKINTTGFNGITANLAPKEFKKQVAENIRNNTDLEKIEKTDFFEHYSANVVSIEGGKKLFPTINGEVVNYKLGIWSFKYKESTKKRKEELAKTNTNNETIPKKDSIVIHYVPFSIISKVSADYMDAKAGTLNDATSFFGAPLTFRFAPSFDLTKNWSYNKIFAGLNGDMRLLAIGDTVTNKLDAGWGAYGSVGITYMGTGYAYDGEDTDDGKRYHGKWSISTMLYWFKSGGTFNKAVFGDYAAKTISGIEMLLRFKTSKKEDSKFNFIIGASNGFTKDAPNFAKWQFRIGVGS
jgi:hypothetical protein